MGEKKRILVFGMTPNYGGVESFMLNYYSHMDRSEVVFDFLCNSHDEIAYEDLFKNMGSEFYKITSRGEDYFKYRKELLSFFKDNANKYDSIWVNICSLVNIDYLKLARKYGIKKRIIHSHNSANYDHNWKDIMHYFNRAIIGRYATDFWACSVDAAKWFYTGNNLAKSKVINNAIDIDSLMYSVEKRKNIRCECGLENKFVLGNVGRLHYQKNQTFLLQLLKVSSDDIRLVLVGQGEDEMKLKQLASELGVSDRVVFAGAQTDIQGWLSSFDLFVFPSLYEGLSVALLEAQANGVPIIGTKKSIADAARINDNIIICEDNSIDEWIAVLNNKQFELMRIDKEQVRLNFSQASFDIETEASKLQELL